jgi:hypothetical protein
MRGCVTEREGPSNWVFWLPVQVALTESGRLLPLLCYKTTAGPLLQESQMQRFTA